MIEIIAIFIGTLVTVVMFIYTNNANNTKYKNELLQTEKRLNEEIKQKSRALSLQYITDKRVEWIYSVREELAKFVATVFSIASLNKTNKDIDLQLTRQVNQSISKLRLYFNFNGDLDNKILEEINNIMDILYYDFEYEQNVGDDVLIKEDYIEIHMTKLIQYSNVYLKNEWERVKMEVEGELSKDEIYNKLSEMEKENLKIFAILNEGI